MPCICTPTRRGGDVAELMPLALVFMQLAFGVCFIAWWAARKLLGVAGHAPEPARPAVGVAPGVSPSLNAAPAAGTARRSRARQSARKR